VLAGSVHGQPYTIKLKDQPDVDKPVVFRELNKQLTLMRTLDTEGKVIDERRIPDATETVYTFTVLKEGARRPARYQRKYETATWTDGKKTVTRSFQGRTILFEMRIGKYLLTVEGKDDLPQEDIDSLAGAANADLDSDPTAVFLPPRPVRVGDSWSVDPKLLAKVFAKDGVVDEKKSSGKGTLVKAAVKDGHLHGAIELDVRVAYSSMGRDKYEPPAILEVKSTLETALDGSSTAGVLRMSGKLTGRTAFTAQQGQKRILDINMEFTGRHERTETK
jgi:hypothetical protein